jgi:PAS domain S-box-containing protein
MKSRVGRFTAVLALAGLYFLSGKFGLSLAFLNRSASAVWPPTGLALAVLLVYGYRLWPGIFLGAFLVNFTTQGSLATIAGIATGNTLEALLGAWLVNRFAGGTRAFERTQNLFPYLFLAALVSTTVSATCGVTSLCLSGLEHWNLYGPVWLTWWLGDMISDVIITPLLLIWMTIPAGPIKAARILEWVALFTVVIIVGAVIFVGESFWIASDPSLEYLALPPLLWVAFRLEVVGAITAAFILAALALWGTLHGYGPFVRADANESLLLLQAFMGAITVTGLVLALLVVDSRRAERRLQLQEAVSRVLAEAAALKEAAPRILRALSGEGTWDWVAIWTQNHSTHQLACAGIWHRETSELDEFETRTRQAEPGVKLAFAQEALKRDSHILIRDAGVPNDFSRASVAFAAGFRTLLFVPLRVGDRLSGVIELFRRASYELPAEMLHMLEAIGSQVAQFIEQKTAEEAQARLAAIVESSPDAIIGKTLDGIITNWNEGATRVFGYSAEEMLGRPISLIIPPDRLEEEARIQDQLRRGEWIAPYETVRVRKDQARIDIALTVSPILDASGRIVGAAKIGRDITEQKNTRRALTETRETLRRYAEDLERRVEERTSKLQDTIRSLDAFCYTIAHDLRGPLRAIIGFSAHLMDQYHAKLDPDAVDFLTRIKNSGSRMDQLILDLLKYGRLNTEELVLEVIDLEELVRKVLSSFADEINQKGAQVQLRAPLLAVKASAVILEQVLTNLVSNALKFVPGNSLPRVEIWTEPRDGIVRLYVRDNGIGIKPQYFSKLFRPFSRLVNDQDFSGTGIGLAIVSKGAERMGGSVGVESEPGGGSCFWIDLPLPGPSTPVEQQNST